MEKTEPRILTVCPICKQPKLKLTDNGIQEINCTCARDAFRKKTLGRFATADLKTITPRNENQAAVLKALLENPEAGRYFYGNYQTGKTHFMAAVFNEIMTRGRKAAWFEAVELFDGMRKHELEGDLIPWIRNLVSTKQFLFIDDVDKTRPTDFNTDAMYKLINRAYLAETVLYFTSNHTLAEIAAAWGGATAARIESACRIVPFKIAEEK